MLVKIIDNSFSLRLSGWRTVAQNYTVDDRLKRSESEEIIKTYGLCAGSDLVRGDLEDVSGSHVEFAVKGVETGRLFSGLRVPVPRLCASCSHRGCQR